MTSEEQGTRVLDIWRILIPEEHVNKGYGTRIMETMIANARESKEYDALQLSYVPGNDLAEHVYRKVGFKATGVIDDGEIVMRMDL
jgi:diamine N-acetyltransferase